VSERAAGKESVSGVLPSVDPDRRKKLAVFQKTVSIRFRSPELLNLSFIHRSASNENADKLNNERLEFLGDAILGAVTATLLFSRMKDRSEGDLAKVKSVVVSEESLAEIAFGLGMDALVVLGKGEESSGGRLKKAILADSLEALIGALYLDSGYANAFGFVERIVTAGIDRVLEDRHRKDYKTLLQELSQRLFKSYPAYRLLRKSGPDHDRQFWMEAVVDGITYGPGAGRNKKDAEQAAAKLAYEVLLKEGSQ